MAHHNAFAPEAIEVVFPMSLMCFKNHLSFVAKLDLKSVNIIKTSVNMQKDECQ